MPEKGIKPESQRAKCQFEMANTQKNRNVYQVYVDNVLI
jgi:hypothetical protein